MKDTMIRRPVVAGQFYPADKKGLEEALSSLMKEGRSATTKNRVKGLILPHAGYMYSGSVAGLTVSSSSLKSTVIILGPNHTGLGTAFSVMTEGVWQTPLGEVKIDEVLAKKIVGQSKHLKSDTLAHHSEHSIEVLLPFLQFLTKEIKFVPIILMQAKSSIYKSIASDIFQVIEKFHLENDITIIASSDMTHYESQDSASQKDHYAIEAIEKLDTDTLHKRVEEKDISMCGVAPVAVMLEVTKLLGAQKANLVKYQTSGEVTGDFSSVVGYAGMRVN